MGSRPRAQSPSSVNKTNQWQLACMFRHAHPAWKESTCKCTTAFRFGAEPFRESPECLQKDNGVGVTARQRRLLSSARSADGVPQLLRICDHAATSPGRFSAFKENFWKSKSKRAPRATGVFLKMASRSCVSGCGRFLASSDGHDRCPSCLGFQHAEAALVDESCSHCGNMTIAMLRSRYLLARRGGIPFAMPRSSSSVLRKATSAHGQGDLRITVRASPSSTSSRISLYA